MRQRQHKFAFLVSVMTVLWSLCQGCPNVPGPTCTEELQNAIYTIIRLKKSLKDLHKTFVDEGYGFREFTGPVCILGNIRDQPVGLDTIGTTLCQYAKCFQHYSDNIMQISILPPNIIRGIKFSNANLKNLENIIKKMKQPSPLCTALCRVSWSFANNTWEEIMKGPLLAQELLTYLEQFNLLEVEAANPLCST